MFQPANRKTSVLSTVYAGLFLIFVLAERILTVAVFSGNLGYDWYFYAGLRQYVLAVFAIVSIIFSLVFLSFVVKNTSLIGVVSLLVSGLLGLYILIVVF
ncbi:MAG: hypothetical protein WDZ79_02940 [Candidatus Paceibacterota bacterium]